MTSAVFLYLVPLERVTSGETFAAQAGEALFGPAGGRVFSGVVIVAVLGSLLGLLMALPRVYYAMANDGVFFKAIAAVHPRFGTPARAIAIQAILASVYVASGTFNQIIGFFVFITVLFVALPWQVYSEFAAARRTPHIGPGAIPSRPCCFLCWRLWCSFSWPRAVRCRPRSASGSWRWARQCIFLIFRKPLVLEPAGSDDRDSHSPANRGG